MNAIDKARAAWSDLLTKLNSAATFVFLYLSMNGQLPAPAEALMSKLPEPWQTVVRILLPITWGTLVEYAKAQAKKRAAATGGASA